MVFSLFLFLRAAGRAERRGWWTIAINVAAAPTVGLTPEALLLCQGGDSFAVAFLYLHRSSVLGGVAVFLTKQAGCT